MPNWLWLPLPVKGLEIGKNWTNLSSPGRPLTKRSSLVRWSQISHYWWQIPVHQRQTTLHQTDIHPDINTTSNVKTTLVWNRVKILRTGRHTTTKNSQESFIDWNVKPVGGRGGGEWGLGGGHVWHFRLMKSMRWKHLETHFNLA